MTQPQAPTDTPSDAAAYARGLLATVRPGACVFDFDGTLVDTSTINTDAARATLADLGLTVPEPWLRHAPLADLTALRHQLQTDHGLPLPCTDAEFVHRARAHWLARTILVKPVPRVTALARHLAAAVPTAVASANDGHVVRAGLNAAGLMRPLPRTRRPRTRHPPQAPPRRLPPRRHPTEPGTPPMPRIREHRRRRHRSPRRHHARDRHPAQSLDRAEPLNRYVVGALPAPERRERVKGRGPA